MNRRHYVRRLRGLRRWLVRAAGDHSRFQATPREHFLLVCNARIGKHLGVRVPRSLARILRQKFPSQEDA